MACPENGAFAVHMEPFSTQFLKGSHGPGDGPAALTRPMERSGGPWLGLRPHLAPPGSDAPPTRDTHFGSPQLAIQTVGGQSIWPTPATTVVLRAGNSGIATGVGIMKITCQGHGSLLAS